MSEITSKQKLELLIRIQTIDSDIFWLKKTAVDLPEEMGSCLAAYNEKETVVLQAKKDIEECQKQCRTKEREIATAKSTLSKFNGRLNEVKTNKEYTAILTEIETVKQKILKTEDEELVFMEKQEILTTSLNKKEAVLKVEEKLVAEKKTENKNDIATVEKRLQEGVEKRKQVTLELDQNLYKHYTKILEMRGGRAVVLYKDGVCEGCSKSILPQMEVLLRKNETVVNCPHCNRFLYIG